MCIRDSDSGTPLLAPGSALLASVFVALLETPAAIQGWRTCLLYTSDAADERSSVDLGGRRIIKKKKIYNK